MSLPPLTPEVIRPRPDRAGRIGAGAVVGISIGCLAAVLAGEVSSHDVPVATRVAEATVPPSPAPVALRAAAVEPRRLGPSAFEIDMAPVLSDGGLRVLLSDEVEAGWLSGVPTMEDDEGLTVVTHPLGKRGQAAFGHAVGARLRLYRADGSSCLARVTGLTAVARLDDGGTIDPAGGARAAWEAVPGARVIAGDLEPLEGRCDDAQMARSESLPAPAITKAVPADSRVEQIAVPALLALPEVKEMFGGEPPHDRTDVVVFRGEAETLVMTTLFAEGCAGQEPAIVAVWKMGPGDALELLGTEEGITDALLAADARGDGRLELVVREDLLGTALLRRTGKRGELSRTDRAPVSILGCRC